MIHNTWILHEKTQPADGQAVIYYFDVVGVHRGHYDADIDTYYGHSGFLGSDVTHWMPDEGQPLPEEPLENKNA